MSAPRMWQRGSRWLLCVLVASALAACSSKEDRSPPRGGGVAGDAADGGDGIARGGDGAHAGAGDSGGGGDLGGAAGSALGGAPGSAGDATSGGEPPVVNPDGPFTGPDPFPCDSDTATADELDADCDPSVAWAAGQEVESGAPPGANLIGITPDELTLVWSEARGSELHYFVADRPSTSAAFEAAQPLNGVTALAVSPDGLRVAALSFDQSALIALERADRSSPFGSESEGEFSVLDEDARARGWSFSSCVFSPDDRRLFYTAGGPDSKYLLHVASRNDSGPWAVGTLLEQCELEVHGGYGRYPTGVSADGQTLFFYDSWRGVTRAAWRDPETSAFRWFKDLGRWSGAQPNAACDRLYYSQPGGEASILSASAE